VRLILMGIITSIICILKYPLHVIGFYGTSSNPIYIDEGEMVPYYVWTIFPTLSFQKKSEAKLYFPIPVETYFKGLQQIVRPQWSEDNYQAVIFASHLTCTSMRGAPTLALVEARKGPRSKNKILKEVRT